jgi:hypothetical protein
MAENEATDEWMGSPPRYVHIPERDEDNLPRGLPPWLRRYHLQLGPRELNRHPALGGNAELREEWLRQCEFEARRRNTPSAWPGEYPNDFVGGCHFFRRDPPWRRDSSEGWFMNFIDWFACWLRKRAA